MVKLRDDGDWSEGDGRGGDRRWIPDPFRRWGKQMEQWMVQGPGRVKIQDDVQISDAVISEQGTPRGGIWGKTFARDILELSLGYLLFHFFVVVVVWLVG